MGSEGAKIRTLGNIQISEPKIRTFFENTVKKSRGSLGWVTLSETQMLFLVQNTLRSAPHNASNVSISFPAPFAKMNPSSSEVGNSPEVPYRFAGGFGTAPHLKQYNGLSTSHPPFPLCCFHIQQAVYLPKSS